MMYSSTRKSYTYLLLLRVPPTSTLKYSTKENLQYVRRVLRVTARWGARRTLPLAGLQHMCMMRVHGMSHAHLEYNQYLCMY